jgi:hypothetical protein
VDEVAVVEPGDEVGLAPGHGSVALDGERELEVHPGERVGVRLSRQRLRTIDVAAVMRDAAGRGILANHGVG